MADSSGQENWSPGSRFEIDPDDPDGQNTLSDILSPGCLDELESHALTHVLSHGTGY